MSRLKWDQTGNRVYQTGVDNGVLYPMLAGVYTKGVAWDGLTKVTESPSGGESSPLYANNKKYNDIMSNEIFGATIEAYDSPDEFDECDGSKEIAAGVFAGQQARKPFGFVYRTLICNDTDGSAYGYTIHIVYNGMAKPSSKDHGTVNESVEAMTMSWEVTTTPVDIPGGKPSAHLEIKSTKTTPAKMKALEDLLYGTDMVGEVPATEPKLPTPAEIITLMGAVV